MKQKYKEPNSCNEKYKGLTKGNKKYLTKVKEILEISWSKNLRNKWKLKKLVNLEKIKTLTKIGQLKASTAEPGAGWCWGWCWK